jgi:hypothetical protein
MCYNRFLSFSLVQRSTSTDMHVIFTYRLIDRSHGSVKVKPWFVVEE